MEYFLGGSLASSLQGEPRATNDIDFVIALPAGRILALRDALGTDFEVDTDMRRDAVLHACCANAFYLPVVTKIDFFGRDYEPFDDSEFSRRRPVMVRATGETIVVKSAEDTVLRKLLWFREGGRASESNGATSCPCFASVATRWTMRTSIRGRRGSASKSCCGAHERREARTCRTGDPRGPVCARGGT